LKKGSGEVNAFLDRHTSITGEITVADTLRVDGTFRGKIVAGREVAIGPTGDVDAEIEAPVISINGRAAGTIRAQERVEIHAQARVTSKLITPSLRIDDGAVFEGQCEMGPRKA
jgi:cytoskeletal protein CcmA (bactofilin family)